MFIFFCELVRGQIVTLPNWEDFVDHVLLGNQVNFHPDFAVVNSISRDVVSREFVDRVCQECEGSYEEGVEFEQHHVLIRLLRLSHRN